MQDIYVTEGSIGREDIFYYRLLEGFNLPPIAARAIVEMGKEFFLKDNDTPGKIGQCKYIAIADTEGPEKQKKDAEHKEISITIDMPEDLAVYQKYGIDGYRQSVILRITNEAREQGALLTIRDLVRLLKSSYSTIKRDLKEIRSRGLFIPIRGTIKDIGPISHKVKIVDLYIRGYTPTEIEKNARHSIKSIERYINDFCKVLILKKKGESIDGIRQIVGISERLTKEYLELCDKYENSEFKSKLDELAETVKIYKPPATYKKGG